MHSTLTDNLLDKAQIAQARCLAYDLFARLFLEGPTPATRDFVAAVPELELALGVGSSLSGIDYDRFASEHYHLFGLNVFPYQSIFLDTEGSLGGQQSNSVLNDYRQAGFELSPHTLIGRLGAGENPDHIGLELAFLSFLSGAEADAQQDGEQLYLVRIHTLQRDFLDRHLLPWLPALVQAISQQGLPFFSELAKLTLELVCEHRTAIGDGYLVRQAAFALPHPPTLLENEKTGLKEIAAYLLTPSYSGLYISRDDITRLGRRQQLPRGFGARGQMLANLLRSAADYDQLPQLISGLVSLLDEWQAAYLSVSEKESGWKPFARAWLERLEMSRELLERVAAGVVEETEASWN